MTKLTIDLTEVKEQGGRTDHIPAGIYNVKIAEIEFIETKSGYAIKPYFTVIDGAEKGKTVNAFLNLSNRTSEENERISQGQFKSILIKCGYDSDPKDLSMDTDELLGRELAVAVADKSREYEGKTIVESEVKKYLKCDKNEVPASMAATPTKTLSEKVAKEAAPSKKPWEK